MAEAAWELELRSVSPEEEEGERREREGGRERETHRSRYVVSSNGGGVRRQKLDQIYGERERGWYKERGGCVGELSSISLFLFLNVIGVNKGIFIF
ncbi:hypothetical protein TIFTF001_035106 [Ficus carica]|uniref:Uncharacterized protein n=1 Tax=Ficus carica TaxID=3494 RepID=A0AA88E130_FICCA|nr:hypothetical protein TIFTF001_035106 [Ficus carica]